jgi:hypothetical protein
MKTTFLFLSIAAVSLVSCEKDGSFFCTSGNGNIITEQRNITGFDGIELSIYADVHIEQSASFSVSVTASENLMSIIDTKVQGSTLKIGTKGNKCINGKDDIDIFITLPDLKKLGISGSGNITSENAITTSSLDISISGSGNIDIADLNTDECTIDISGSGNVKLAGSQAASEQEIHISGSGDINTLDLMTAETEVHISGSGKAQVYCTSKLDAAISGSGDVIYKGTPIITAFSSGSGSVRPY